MSRRQLTLALVLIVIGAVAAAYSCYLRLESDRHYHQVRVLLDWQGLASLPAADDEAELTGAEQWPAAWELAQEFPGAWLCYGEETVGGLLAQGILQRAPTTTGAPCYFVADPRFVPDVYQGATRHGYWVERSDATSGRLYVQFPDLAPEDLAVLPVAWLASVIDGARERGIPILLRPGGSEFLGANGLERTLSFCGEQDLVLFQGPQVLGWPSQIGQVATELRDAGQYFGWIEFDEQTGGEALAAKLAPNVLRVHSIPPEELAKYTPEAAVARMLRAVRERGIRCLYVRPFTAGKAVAASADSGYREQLLQLNREYFRSLWSGLEELGFGQLSPIKIIGGPPNSPNDPPAWLRIIRPALITLAVLGAIALLLLMWAPSLPRWIYSLVLWLSLPAAAAAVLNSNAFSLVLLACALVFPLLGFWLALLGYHRLTLSFACKLWCPRRLLIALLCLLVAMAFSVLGGLLIHGGMWDAATMLKIGQFRGVSLALGLPLVILAVYTWKSETLAQAFDSSTRRLTPYWQRFLDLWHSPIRYGDVAFLLIAVGALGIVLLRSGNDSPLEVLNLETWFRSSLEQLLAVRPRTKELLGHPLLILFLLSLPWRNRLSLLLALGAMLAQVSVLNTFCHLHTPLAITLQRVALGLGFGLCTGSLLGLLALLGTWLWHRLGARRAAEAALTPDEG